MKIIPREGILLVEKIANAELKHEMIMEEDESDKKLIVGRVMEDGSYPKGTLIVFGKYSIFKLTYKGNNYSFIEDGDVISVIK